MLRPQSARYLLISGLPASLPRDPQRTPTTRPLPPNPPRRPALVEDRCRVARQQHEVGRRVPDPLVLGERQRDRTQALLVGAPSALPARARSAPAWSPAARRRARSAAARPSRR